MQHIARMRHMRYPRMRAAPTPSARTTDYGLPKDSSPLMRQRRRPVSQRKTSCQRRTRKPGKHNHRCPRQEGAQWTNRCLPVQLLPSPDSGATHCELFSSPSSSTAPSSLLGRVTRIPGALDDGAQDLLGRTRRPPQWRSCCASAGRGPTPASGRRQQLWEDAPAPAAAAAPRWSPLDQRPEQAPLPRPQEAPRECRRRETEAQRRQGVIARGGRHPPSWTLQCRAAPRPVPRASPAAKQ